MHMDSQQNLSPISLPPINDNNGVVVGGDDNKGTVGSGDQNANQAVVATRPLTGIGVAGEAPVSSPAAGGALNVQAPVIADDVDLIEKEWVHKVKEIIAKTAKDPYEKSRQLTLIKADYLQKRYNKTIKLT